MAKVKSSYEEILVLAEQYSVKDNVLFVSAAKRYDGQMEMIRKIEEELRTNGMVITKVNTNGDDVPIANPMASQLPKYNEVANKTLGVMLDIIEKLGSPMAQEDDLSEFRR